MQIDAHYYGTYLLLRALGYSPKDAYTVAYANQYTDDSDESEVIELAGGVPDFNPVRTAHYGLDWKLLKKKNMNLVAQQIWMSFHFLPAGIKGKYPTGPLLTRPGKGPAGALVKRALRWIDGGRPYGLHALGIATHSFLDTYSHQYFSGRRGAENRVTAKPMLSRRLAKDRSLINFLKKEIKEYAEKNFLGINIIPNIGHAEAMHHPDRPFLRWQYYDWKNKPYSASNLDRFMQGVGDLFALIAAHIGLSETQQHKIWHADKNKDGLYDVFAQLFQEDDWNKDDRVKNWCKALPGTGYVRKSEVKYLDYDDKAWLNDAIDFPTALEAGTNHMAKAKAKGNFAEKDFVMFHEAARRQRQYVMNWIKRKGLDTLIETVDQQI